MPSYESRKFASDHELETTGEETDDSMIKSQMNALQLRSTLLYHQYHYNCFGDITKVCEIFCFLGMKIN